MSDRLALRLSEKFAIFFDANQWIVVRRQMRGDKPYWQPLSFIGSSTSVLRRVLREKRIELTPDNSAEIGRWPKKFKDWLNVYKTKSYSSETSLPLNSHRTEQRQASFE